MENVIVDKNKNVTHNVTKNVRGGFFVNAQEKDMIKRAQLGDENAYREVYEHYYHLVFYYAWNLSRNETDARDITQEVFLQVYKSLPNLREIDLFVPWIRKITSSKAQTMFRKNKDHIYDPEQISAEAGKEERFEYVPHEYVEHVTDKEILKRLMLQLSKRRYEVLDLFYFQQMNLEEIAKILNVSVGTVKSRLHTGRLALHKIVNEYEQQEGRKLTFHLDSLVPLASLSFVATIKQICSQSKFLNIANAAALTACVVVGSFALKETYDLIQPIPNEQASIQAEQPKPVQSEQTSISFTPIIYKNQTISSTNDAYFILMDFASDQELLKEKTQEELLEIQPVINELCYSDNAYKDVLLNNGWITTYHSLL